MEEKRDFDLLHFEKSPSNSLVKHVLKHVKKISSLDVWECGMLVHMIHIIGVRYSQCENGKCRCVLGIKLSHIIVL